MKRLFSIVLGFAALMAEAAEDPRRAQSAEIAARFQKVLGERLMSAMVADGPVAAIGVCRHEAPEVAARLSAETGTKVARTALRVRNPDNAPDAGEWAVLKTFERDLKAGVKSSPEHFEVAADGSARYLKAILTQPACLSCHGAVLAPEVKAAIARHYPNDQATGFAVGDLRGAFVIEWPASGGEHP